MTDYYVDSFIEITVLAIVAAGILILTYLAFGLLKASGTPSPMKKDPYSGGKKNLPQATFFKSTFFQYAIYFLVFDVVAFITALSAFNGNLKLFDNWKFVEKGIYPVIYLLIVLSLFIIFPKHEEEII